MTQINKLLFAFVLVVLAVGCAPLMQPPLKPLEAGNQRAAGKDYVVKVASFEVILDSSLSMDSGRNYFFGARDIVSRINQGLPTDLKYKAGLRSFGHSSYQSENPTELLYGMTDYNRSAFHDGLNRIKYTGGLSPLAAAIEAAGKDLQGASGKSALIIVSDGLNVEDAPAAAQALKAKLGPNVCIYTIAIGNEMNGAGQKRLQKVAEAGGCGSATKDKALASPAGMKAFINEVFVAKAPPKPAPVVIAPQDSDGDGVFDAQDQCPDTPRGEFVDEHGCTLKLTLHVNFDIDSALIKTEFTADLEKAAAYIHKYSKVPYVLIAGRYPNRRVEIICCVLKPE